MLVKVAIDLSLDRLFTYEVPEGLRKKLAIGQLLSVPFGHREARGFAMEVEGEGGGGGGVEGEGGGYRLRPITAIVDETPFFSTALLTLIRKLSTYTAAPLESMLKAALPASVLKKNVRPRELLYVEPMLSIGGIKLTERQQWLYDQIVRLGGGYLASLCEELKTTPATLRQLGQRGLIALKVRARRRDPLGSKRILPTHPLKVNDEQAAALRAIGAAEKPLLLHGVTGSGKTEVYLQAIAAELAAGRGAIVMVPEIALTPQTVQRFASRFGNQVAVLHSALSDGERYDEWHRIRAGEARVVVGPRSAVFAPVRNLGLVVVDEEHEPSYKQEDNPRYHARDAAVLRGMIEGAKVVLGSATPSLETWLNVERGKYAQVAMACRAGAGKLPAIHLVDRSAEGAPGTLAQGAIFSPVLLEAMRLRLDRGEQTILFLNRRGYARQFACAACGFVAECPACSLPYTYHRVDRCLRCHVCGGWAELPKACPKCGSTAFSFQGIGTQRVEAALAKCFPRAAIIRMDADSVSRRHSHDELLSAFRRGEADILLGTQMIAKGLDFPNVTLVGVLNADSSLNRPDFRANERTFQLLAQVAGRAGRAELPGEVFIQSYDPKAPVLGEAARGDFAAFARRELRDREEGFYPPYCHLAMVNFRSKDLRFVADWAEMYAKGLKNFARQEPGLVVGEALPSSIEKADGWYRWQVMLRSVKAASILKAWRWISSARPPKKDLKVALDMDALNLV